MKALTLTFLVTDEQIPILKKLIEQFHPVPNDNLTLAEVCREFDLCPSTVDRWVNKEKLVPCTQPVPGGKKFVRRADILQLMTAKAAEKAKPKRRKSILNMTMRGKKKPE